MANVLSGFALLIGLAWLIALIAFKAGFGDAVTHQRLGCIVYIFSECENTVEKIAYESAPKLNMDEFSDITKNLSSSPASNLSVNVQFAGAIARDTIRAMMKDLAAKNWKMVGTAGGGERTSAAAGYAEVRYSGNNKAAAEALAKAVSAYGIAGRPLKAVANPDIAPGELDVWISN